MMNTEPDVQTLVISEQVLIRVGAKSLFAGSHYRVCGECASVKQAADVQGWKPDLIFLGAAIDEAFISPLKSLKETFPNSRIVAYATEVRLSVGVAKALETYIDGCVNAKTTVSALLLLLDLIIAGVQIVPQSLLISDRPVDGRPRAGAPGVYNHLLISEREKTVLELLRDGHSNKGICRELLITEATVKSHVKSLLRKIGASNRTQLAVWAVKNDADRQITTRSLQPTTPDLLFISRQVGRSRKRRSTMAPP